MSGLIRSTIARRWWLLYCLLIGALFCPVSALAWPATPPRIGNLKLSQEYWGYVIEAAHDYDISPFIIQGVMAIESRYDPWATSGRGRCIGLMQLDRGVARMLQVNPWDPRENIRGGAQVLARLLKKYDGNQHLAIRAYNGTGNRAYEREVIRAVRQAAAGGKI